MKISYAITVCDELHEVKRLLDTLLQLKREQDEICVLLDETKSSTRLENLLQAYVYNYKVVLKINKFQNHFADWKNQLMDMCSGDYIFQIDADEYPNEYLIESLPEIFKANPTVEAFVVPRVNTIEGLTPEHIAKWRWHVNEKGWVNFPDYQWRIYKNLPEIKWKNKVHEVIEGYKVMAQLPGYEDFSLYHPKTIEKQEAAVKLYQTIDPTVKEKI